MLAQLYAMGPSQESELIALSNAWVDARVHHDKAALERVLDERFLVTFTCGNTVDRTAFVARIMTAEIKPFGVLNEVLNIHGDTALVIGTTTDHTTKFTWVAVKKDGQPIDSLQIPNSASIERVAGCSGHHN